HRDLKPDNVMIIRDPLQSSGERAKVLDFGIARLGSDAAAAPDGAASPRLTRTGTVIGTPIYMAPEQCRGAGRVDGKADVYSLGIMLFQLLVGRPPFQAEGLGALMAMHIYESPPALTDCLDDVPERESLDLLLSGLLAKEPQERPSMEQFLQLLEPIAAACPFVRSALPLNTPAEVPYDPAGWATAQGRRSTLSSAVGSRTGRVAASGQNPGWRAWLGIATVLVGMNAGIWQVLRPPSPQGSVQTAASLPPSASAPRPSPLPVTSSAPQPAAPIPEPVRPLVMREAGDGTAGSHEVHDAGAPTAKRLAAAPRRTARDGAKGKRRNAPSPAPRAPASSSREDGGAATDTPPETPDF
ncbi:MAG TPA: protein kinase, partial [Pseudomonadota bacterium]|nr:protein kinase [Pseudomonadota bacterium]